MSKRILFVDGDQTIAGAVNCMLGEMGYQVRTETSGMDALAIFSHNPASFDLIITDLGMPDISGLLLAEKFLKMRGDIPILLLTGEDGERLSKARETGIRWFGAKPLSMAALAETVKKALAEAA
jgi:DNA-binding NtrC family response regulator